MDKQTNKLSAAHLYPTKMYLHDQMNIFSILFIAIMSQNNICFGCNKSVQVRCIERA